MYVSALFTLHSYFLYTAPYVNMEQADKTPDAKVDETPSIDANMELVDKTPDQDIDAKVDETPSIDANMEQVYDTPNIDAITEKFPEAEAICSRSTYVIFVVIYKHVLCDDISLA